MTRRISISEARRLLPQLVREVAAEGGRIDITFRGKPQVSLLRVADGRSSRDAAALKRSHALKVELVDRPEVLLDAIREIRRSNVPRTGWLADEPRLRGRRKARAKKSARVAPR